MNERSPRALAVVLLVAAGLRLAWVVAVDVDPRRDFHFDMTWYDLAALRVEEGALLRDADGTPTAFWPPGYPILLGVAYALFGPHLIVAKLLNVMLATATCWFTWGLSTRLFGQRVGLLAAALLALLPDHVWFTPLLLSELPFTALLTGLLWLFAVWDARGASLLHWAVFGALLGVAILTRGTASLFLVVPFTAWWLATRSLGASLRRTLAVAAGALVVVAPWTLRNALAMGSPIAVSSSIGMSFLFAHNPHADGAEGLQHVQYRDALLRDLRALPNPEREVAEMQRGMREGVAWALANPARELALVPLRWRELYRHGHAGLDWSVPTRGATERAALVSPTWDRVLAAGSDVLFFALLGLAALGVPLALAGRRAAALALPLTVAYVSLLHGLLFVGNPRYHAPLLPVLSILAACGMQTLWRRRRGGRHSG